MDKGIFNSMFDTVDEAGLLLDAYSDADMAGEGHLWREHYNRLLHERAAPARRHDMLLIERAFDEWSDTKRFLFNRLFRLAMPSPYDLGADFRLSLAQKLLRKAEDAVFDVTSGIALRIGRHIGRRRAEEDEIHWTNRPDASSERS